MINVLIVDDSTFMRVRIRSLLETEPRIKIIGIARDGRDALEKTRIFKPDVITMDVNMPDISGIEAVELIMEQCPTPIIMISSFSYSGSKETLEALEKGAVDFIHKDQLSEEALINKIFIAHKAKLNTAIDTTCAKPKTTIELAPTKGIAAKKLKTNAALYDLKVEKRKSNVTPDNEKVKINATLDTIEHTETINENAHKKQTASDTKKETENLINSKNRSEKNTYSEIEISNKLSNIRVSRTKTFDDSSEIPDDSITANRTFSIIGIGISTGGPKALSQLIPDISPDIPASIVIAQHMPAAFTKPLAERLDSSSAIRVKEAEDGEPLLPGYAYICPGGKHIMIEHTRTISLYDKDVFPDHHFRPAASLLMSSIAKVYADEALCIIMTGMGSDGLEGIAKARERGGYILAQSENSSTIFGMPKAIISNKLQHEIVHLDHIAERINKLCLW